MIRREVQDFVLAGPLPSEDEVIDEELEQLQSLFEAIVPPVSVEEAHLLLKAFGKDECFGAAWALLHLIETAPPTFPLEDADGRVGEEWICRLRRRREAPGLG